MPEQWRQYHANDINSAGELPPWQPVRLGSNGSRIMKMRILFLSVLSVFASIPLFSASLDNGVDPFNLGKGDWIWEVPQSQTAIGVTNVQGLIDYEKNKGMQWITVKCGDGGSVWTQFDTNIVARAHAAGMKIFGWAYAYGNNVQGEINVGLNALAKGADGFIIDAEAEYETNIFNNAKAIKYCQAIRQQYPTRLLAHAPSPSVHFHPTFPYLEFGTYSDVIMPQDYWGYRGISPGTMLSVMDSEIRTNLYNVWSGSATNAIKPICPVAQADQPTVPGSDESDFVFFVQTDASPLTPAAYHGVSFWDAQEHTAAQWTAIGATNIALMTNVSPRIPGPPINRCVNQGSNVTFTVTAYGAPTLSYQWRLAGANIAAATNTSYTVASAQPASAGGYTVVVSNAFGISTSGVATLTVVSPFPYLQPVFSDNFETNSAALWSLFQGSGNGVSDFSTNWAFSYSNQTYRWFGVSSTATTNNIPVAPGTLNGTKVGLKLTVNKNDGTAAQSGVSLYPAGLGALSNCVLRFDAWINYAGGPNGETASGTTEMLTCGLNHTGTRVNWLDVGTATSSDGTWFAVDGEGGTGSPMVGSYSPGSDYRAFKGNGASGPTHLSFASSGLGINGAQSEDVVDRVYRDLFAYPDYESPGTPGKHWVQVELSQYNGLLTWRLNGQVVAQRQNTSAFTNGVPMIGYMDPFSSIASPAAENFLLIDNVSVYAIIDPPVVTAQPASLTNNAGTSANFSVTATGTAPLAYQWQKNSVNVSGATTATLSLSGVSQSDAASYRCIITNVAGSATSSVATLTVIDAPLITAQPVSLTNAAGATANFSITASGTAPLAYQWQKGGVNLSDGGNVSGSTTATLTLAGVSQSDAASYTCIVTNTAGSATSAVATLTVIDPPVIAGQPSSRTNNAGTAANFTVTATGTSPVFQWQKNSVNLSDGGNVSGSTTATLTLTGVSQSDAAGYRCVLTNLAGSVTSVVATLTVIDPPTITGQPSSRTNNAGTTANFTVTATGTSPVFQWQKNSVSLSDGGNVSGSATATLTLTGVSQADAASYTCVVTNAAGSATSAAATLTVIDPPVITGQPSSRTNNAGTAANFTVTASGTSPVFQWQKNSANLSDGGNVSGSTTATLTLTGVSQSDAAGYRCVLTNLAGSVTSVVATLTVIDPPVITVQPQDQIAGQAGASVSFSVTASGTAPLSYQWSFNGGAISGATGSSFAIGSVQTANIGAYSVVVSNPAGSVTSSNAALQIGRLFYSDNLDTDTSANWFIAANHTDSRATWAFDYSLRADRSGPGVPQNPYYTNSSKALKLEANISSGTVINAISLSPKVLNLTGDFQLRFDAWQNWVGPAPSGGTGSTESITAGICHPGGIVEVPQTTTNAGVFIAANGDGGVAAANNTIPDYAVYTNATAGGAAQLVGTNTGCYVASNSGGNPATFHGNSYYTNISGAIAPTIQTATSETNSTLAGAANQTGTTKVGNFGFKWHEVILRKTGDGTGTTNISWYIDGFRIASVTNALMPAGGTNVSLGYFDGFASIAATNFEFGLFSSFRVETFYGAGVAPAITSQPASVTNNAGTTASFSVSATSPTTLRYQWLKNGAKLADGGNLSGATNSTLTITNVQSTDAGAYHCILLNDSSSTTTAEALLTVVQGPGGHLVVTPPPVRAVVSSGPDTMVLSANASPNSPYVIEAASSLTAPVQWTPVETNFASPEGLITFTNSFGGTQQFFRIKFQKN